MGYKGEVKKSQVVTHSAKADCRVRSAECGVPSQDRQAELLSLNRQRTELERVCQEGTKKGAKSRTISSTGCSTYLLIPHARANLYV